MKKIHLQYITLSIIALFALQIVPVSSVYAVREVREDVDVRTTLATSTGLVENLRGSTETIVVERTRIYRESFETVLDARDRYRETNSLADRSLFESRARAYLKTSIEEYVHRLQATIQWIDSNPRGSVAVLAGARLELNTKISELQNLHASVDTMNYEQIKEFTLEVRAELLESRSILRSILERLKQARLVETQQKVLAIVNTIDQKIDVYESNGYDMSIAQTLIVDIRNRLSSEPTQESVMIAYGKARELLNHLKQVLQTR
jgi:hypothetical protein